MLDNIDGLHFHVMCEQNSDTLERVLRHVEEKFAKYLALPQIKWVNFGGGHHITRQDYDIELLIKCINYIQKKYDVQVYLEPGVLEMPYRPIIIHSEMPGVLAYTYRFGGNTCLAGDIIGDYSFNHQLKAGEKLVFTDMAHYSMVKNNTFNGIGLPSIMIYNDKDGLYTVRDFGYQDFKERLS